MVNVIAVVAMAIFGVMLAPAHGAPLWHCVGEHSREVMAFQYDGTSRPWVHLLGSRASHLYTIVKREKDEFGRQRLTMSHGHFGQVVCTKQTKR